MSDLDLTGRCILLVEDEYLVARSLTRLLKIWRATIEGPVATIGQALELLAKADQIDFALVDINLRGVGSFPVADALAARAIPFAFTTGYETSMIPERYRNVAVLQKPFNSAVLAKELAILTS